MNIFRSFSYTIFLLAALFLATGPVSALDYSVSGDYSCLTDDSNLRWNAMISGGNVVWVEKFGTGQAVYLYNISKKEKNLITFSRYSEYFPFISDEKIVWSEKFDYNTPSQAVLYNILTGKYRYLDFYPANQGSAAVSGDYVVWLDGRYYGFSNIFLKDTKTGSAVLFRESKTGDKKSPVISGDYVYWVEKGFLNKKPVSGGEISVIAEGVPGGFSVSDGRIVWEQYSGDYYSVMMYDERDGSIISVAEGDFDNRHPSVSGNIVIYENYKNKNSEVYLYDISTKTTASVYPGTGSQINPGISGRRIIWTEENPGKYNLILFDILPGAKPKAEFSANNFDSRDGLPPLVIHFSGSSMITPGSMTSYVWDFGDGERSFEGSPVHTYKSPGIYNVSLLVSNDFGEDLVVRDNYVTVGELPHADFTFEETSGVAPYVTRFHDISTGDIDERLWNFGDGTGSVLRNPYHLFEKPGMYTVNLTVTNRYGSMTETKEDLIYVA